MITMPRIKSIEQQIKTYRETIENIEYSVTHLNNRLTAAKTRKDLEEIKIHQYESQIIVKQNIITSYKKTIKMLTKKSKKD